MLGRTVALFALMLTGVSCRDRKAEHHGLPRPVESPAPPRQLVATLRVDRPGELWERVRPYLTRVSVPTPRSLELSVGAALGLPPLVATQIEINAPWVGALAVDAAGPGIVIGVRVRSGAELVASLTTGARPSYRVEVQRDVAVLSRVDQRGSEPPLAVIEDALLFGQKDKLAKLGPFLVATHHSTAEPSQALRLSIPGSKLAETVVPMLRRSWSQRRAELEGSRRAAEQSRGRAADFADPGFVLGAIDAAVESGLGVLSRAQQARLEVRVEQARVLFDLILVPDPARGRPLIEPLGQVSLAALQRLPEDAIFGLLLGRNASGVSSTSSWLDGLKRLFGSRISEDDLCLAGEVLSLLDAGRGREQLFGVRADGALIWTGAVENRERLEAGMRKILDLLGREALIAPLAARLGTPRWRFEQRVCASDCPPARAARVRFSPNAAGRVLGRVPRDIEFLYSVGDERFNWVVAPDADHLFDSLTRGSSPRSDLEPIELLAETRSAALAGALDLGVLGGLPRPGRAPAAFAVSEREGALGIRLVLSDRAMDRLARILVSP